MNYSWFSESKQINKTENICFTYRSESNPLNGNKYRYAVSTGIVERANTSFIDTSLRAALYTCNMNLNSARILRTLFARLFHFSVCWKNIFPHSAPNRCERTYHKTYKILIYKTIVIRWTYNRNMEKYCRRQLLGIVAPSWIVRGQTANCGNKLREIRNIFIPFWWIAFNLFEIIVGYCSSSWRIILRVQTYVLSAKFGK